jgi:hypothetical protein
MSEFTIATGIATLLSLALALYLWTQARRKEAVEQERVTGQQIRLSSLLASLSAIDRQLRLVAVVADRPETTAKEMKHLAISALEGVEAARNVVAQEFENIQGWKLGVPSGYRRIRSVATESVSPPTE